MNRLAMILMTTLALPAAAAAALAPPRAPTSTPAPAAKVYRQECAACHIAYPPAMLPAASWQHLLSNLPRHYGTDASLDAAGVQQLARWLGAEAASGRRKYMDMPADDRITRSGWFVRKHDELPPAIWKRPAVKSASNCMACHAGADKGEFNEHDVHIPR